jgi:hypothetical protein
MTHWRNGGKTVGGLDQSSRLHISAYTTRADLNSVAAAGPLPASRRNSGEPSSRLFIDESDMEFAAYVLVLVAVGFPCLFLGAVYLLLVA